MKKESYSDPKSILSSDPTISRRRWAREAARRRVEAARRECERHVRARGRGVGSRGGGAAAASKRRYARRTRAGFVGGGGAAAARAAAPATASKLIHIHSPPLTKRFTRTVVVRQQKLKKKDFSHPLAIGKRARELRPRIPVYDAYTRCKPLERERERERCTYKIEL